MFVSVLIPGVCPSKVSFSYTMLPGKLLGTGGFPPRRFSRTAEGG